MHGNITVNIISSDAVAFPSSDEEAKQSPELDEQQVKEATEEGDGVGALILALVIGVPMVGWIAVKVFGIVHKVAAAVGNALDWVAPAIAILGGVVAVMGLGVLIDSYAARYRACRQPPVLYSSEAQQPLQPQAAVVDPGKPVDQAE
ncbi:hypothetical protein ABZ851_09100 [Streptomyces sp. NPDC047049]|uniref:hypothetical protein n=1 Tax=Streptomyces sp. NPDC047049 TaxID=3156688 RepID=UPI0033D8CFBA